MSHSTHGQQIQSMENDYVSESEMSLQYFTPPQSGGSSNPSQPDFLPIQQTGHPLNYASDSTNVQQQISSHSPSSFITCLWADCQAQFSALPDLVTHVNMCHLQAPEVSPIDAISCLWADCTSYPTMDSLPGPSSGHVLDGAIGALTNHLLHDHLGLPNSSVLAPPKNTAPLSAGEAAEHTPPSTCSSHSSLRSTPTPPDGSTDTHCCRWSECGQSFDTCDSLTAHITGEHVGSGRARYECFWAGCCRNGERGFISKQKICRHLQVRDLPSLFDS
jgi:hypothetical protein